MTTNITLDMILANFEKRGVKYKFYKTKADALTHNRNGAGVNTNATPGGFGPLYGFVVHNFASDISDANSNNYLYIGDKARGMPGPLVQFSLDDEGCVWVIGWGAATHTGPGDKETVTKVKADQMPLSSDVTPDGSVDSGAINPFFLGVEMLYGGKGPTTAQRTALIPFVAAVIEVLGTGYSGGSVAMHREFSVQRSDPQFFKGFDIRKAVNAQLSKWKAGPVAPTPTVPKDDLDMTPAERAALINDIKNAVWADIPWANKDGIPASTARNNMGWQTANSVAALALLRDLAPRVVAIEAALSNDSVDIDAFKTAAKEAFDAALQSNLKVSVNPQDTV